MTAELVTYKDTSCSPPWYDSDEEEPDETETTTQEDETALLVEDELERMTKGSGFVKRAPPCVAVARFHYDELQVGDVALQGTFGETCPLENVELDDVYAAADEGEEYGRHHITFVLRKRNAYAFSLKQVATSLREEGDTMEICRATAHLLVEVRYLARLDHPGILQVHGLATSGMSDASRYDNFSVITDRVTETLRDRLASWKHDQKQQELMRRPSFLSVLSEPESVLRLKMEMAWQLADALDYLHQRNICYGNLTPDTIGFKQDLRNPHTSSDSTVMLINFEQAREVQTKAELKSDVLSWSTVFYEMLTLQDPDHEEMEDVRLPGEEPRRRLRRTRSIRMSQSMLIPSSVQMVLKKAWNRDPEQRLSISQIMEELDNLLLVIEDEESHIGLDLEDEDISSEEEEVVEVDVESEEEEASQCGSLKPLTRRPSFLPDYCLDTLIDSNFLNDMSASVQNSEVSPHKALLDPNFLMNNDMSASVQNDEILSTRRAWKGQSVKKMLSDKRTQEPQNTRGSRAA